MAIKIDTNGLLNSISTIDRNKELWNQYYSQPQYVGPELEPGNPFALVNHNNSTPEKTFFQSGLESPQPLAPHGANARVLQNSDAAQGLIDMVSNPFQKANEQFNPTSNYMKDLSSASENRLEELSVDSPKSSFDTTGAISSGVNFASNAFTALNGTDASESESWAKTGQLALSGAQAGMQIGGPFGAAIGGVAGGVMGLINKKKDKDRRGRMIDERNDRAAERSMRERRTEYEIKQAEKDIESLTAMNKSKLNYL